jgi:hypothetical protein
MTQAKRLEGIRENKMFMDKTKEESNESQKGRKKKKKRKENGKEV